MRLLSTSENLQDPSKKNLLSRLHTEQRGELCENARATMAVAHKKMEAIRHLVWTTLKEGDLVLLWNAQMGKHMGKKLESQWLEPH